MFSDRVFQIALTISVVIHAGIFAQNASFSVFSKNLKQQKVEVRYVKGPPSESKQQPQRQMPAKREPLLPLPEKLSVQRSSPPAWNQSSPARDISKITLPSNSSLTKPVLVKPDLISIKKRITFPAVDMDKNKINNPSYISYYQMVREKIRRAAYQNYNRTENGEVYMSFLIARNGTLNDARLVDERSSLDTYLRDIALRSIKDAAPFPAFPADLDYPRLSFNVVISFEVE